MTSVTHACCLWRVQATSVSYSDKKAGSTRVCVCVCVSAMFIKHWVTNQRAGFPSEVCPGLSFSLSPCTLFHFLVTFPLLFFSFLLSVVSLSPCFLSISSLSFCFMSSTLFPLPFLPCLVSSAALYFLRFFQLFPFCFLFPRLIPLSSLSSSFYTLLRSPSCLVSLFPTSFRSPFPVSSFIYFFFLFPFCLLVSSPLYLHLLFYSILVSLLPSLDLLSYFPFVPCLLYLCCFLISSSSLVLSPPKHTHTCCYNLLSPCVCSCLLVSFILSVLGSLLWLLSCSLSLSQNPAVEMHDVCWPANYVDDRNQCVCVCVTHTCCVSAHWLVQTDRQIHLQPSVWLVSLQRGVLLVRSPAGCRCDAEPHHTCTSWTFEPIKGAIHTYFHAYYGRKARTGTTWH